MRHEMSTSLRETTQLALKEYAVTFMAMKNPMFERLERIHRDRIVQGLMNNLWDNNPGELERWADDGGFVP